MLLNKIKSVLFRNPTQIVQVNFSSLIIRQRFLFLNNNSLRSCSSSSTPTTTTPSTTAETPTTTAEIIQKWKKKLEHENVPEIKSSLDNILAHVLGRKRIHDAEKIMTPLSETELERFEKLCECRMARMPIQYIIGEWDFRDVTLKMVPPVFIPRPETEELVELILQQIESKRNVRFLEVGCGTGAISIALLRALPKATCLAIDQSKIACDLSLKNAMKLNVHHRMHIKQHKLIIAANDEDDDDDSFSTIENFNLIVSNPPYVPTKELLQVEPEIKLYEDLRALDGGNDGLNIVKSLIKLASEKLCIGGTLWMEVHSSHPKLITKYLEDNIVLNLKVVATYCDMFKRERFIEIVKC